MRFELDTASIESLQSGATLQFGIDHERMQCEVTVGDPVRTALLADLD